MAILGTDRQDASTGTIRSAGKSPQLGHCAPVENQAEGIHQRRGMDLETLTLDGSQPLGGHGHAQFHLCIVHDGGFAERVDGAWRDCGPGTVRVSPAHTRHELALDAGGLRCSMVELPDITIRGLSRPLRSSSYHKSATVGDLAERLVRAWTSADRFTAECLALEVAARTAEPSENPHPPGWIDQLKTELTEHSTYLYSLSETARRYQLNRSHLARAFRRWCGRSPGAYVRAHRTYVAADRLSSTDQPLAQLAYDLGFVDQAHFSRVFTRQFGVSPGQYRHRTTAPGTTQLSYKTHAPVHHFHS